MFQTCGSLGSVNEDLDINDAQNMPGLYFLGNISISASSQSLTVCAFGKVDTSTYGNIQEKEVAGVVIFYVIRKELDGTLSDKKILLRQSNDSLSRECRNVHIEIKSSDSIVMYIPNNCSSSGGEKIDCPLQVNFHNKSNLTGYYEASYEINVFNPARSQIRNELMHRQQQVLVDSVLNVEITFNGMHACSV